MKNQRNKSNVTKCIDSVRGGFKVTTEETGVMVFSKRDQAAKFLKGKGFTGPFVDRVGDHQSIVGR